MRRPLLLRTFRSFRTFRTFRTFLPTLAATCLIAAAPVLAVDSPVTFAEHVAPIFYSKCVSCHRPGEVAPMSLMSYKEARPWAKSVARAVKGGEMPPWSGESDVVEFKDALKLSADQIDTLIAWAQQGAPEGDAAATPEAPTFPDTWTLGEPDLVVTLSPVEVPAEGEDLFPKEVLELGLTEERWVRAIEFLPGDRRVAHHYQSTYMTPGRDGGQIGTSDVPARNGVFGIWTAGMSPYVFPDGMGRILGPGTKILMDSHYHPMGEATTDVTRIGVYFGEGELEKEVATIPVTNTGLRIPPGAGDHPELAYYKFHTDMQILAFSPHMHVRGKAMKYEMITPDGKRETLLDVPEFDYNWQWLYYPTELIDVPAGSVVEVTARWDNSAENPANPDPSQEIIYRGDTFNEMFNGFLEVVQKDGIAHTPPKPVEKVRQMLADQPAADSYLAGGFLPFGFYVPKEGEGWIYLSQGLVTFTTTLDDFEWNGDELRITTQFPTPEASATTTTIVGKLNQNGDLQGTISVGSDTDKPLEMPFLGKSMAKKGGASSSAGD